VHGLNIGGLEKQMLQHIRCFLSLGEYQISLILISKTSQQNNLYKELPEGVELFQMNFRHGYSLLSYIELAQILKKINPDLIISSQFLANTAVRAIRLFTGYKVIAREHNVHPEWNIFHKLVNAFLFRFSNDVYLAVSKEAAQAAAEASFVPLDKVGVIENGIDFEIWSNKKKTVHSREAVVERYGLNRHRKYILCVARLTHKKRLDRLLQAYATFLQSNDQYDLLLIGDGAERRFLESQVRSLSISDRVYILGAQKNVEDLYCVADIFALSSDHEGFPNVLLEALYFQLPIVSTSVPGASSVIVSADIGVITQNNPGSLCEGLLTVSKRTPDQIAKQKNASREHVKNFSIDKIAQKYIKLFNDLQV